MIVVDGSQGEGGGQILRTSLALSIVTGQPLRIENIRARRKRPGLMRQHLSAVEAAVAVGGASVRGASLGSGTLDFAPTGVYPGRHHIRIGTAGSATLVLQTVLPPLLATAREPSELVVEGGTHNGMAPPYDFLARCFAPLLAAMGGGLDLTLERHGFYPAGGGQIRATITPPADGLGCLELLEPGAIRERRARALIARLPRHVAERELGRVATGLGWPPSALHVETPASRGPGNALVLEVERANVTQVVTGFGRRGVPAERVADGAVAELQRVLDARVPVCEHLADQLLLPLALGRGGRYRTVALSDHTRTNIDVIRQFLPVTIETVTLADDRVEVSVQHASDASSIKA